MTALFIILLLASIPTWLWLCIRIWRVSPVGAILSFLFGLPALYWVFKLWDAPEAKIRPAFFSYVGVLVLTVVVGAQLPEDWGMTLLQGAGATNQLRHATAKKQGNAGMERWCREQNDAVYDPDLKTCVERGKQEALAQESSNDLFGRLTQHMKENGLQGEFDHDQSAAAVRHSAEIADVAGYYFWPLSMSQPRVAVMLCVSASACATYVENSKERDTLQMLRNANLLLVMPLDAKDDPRMQQLESAFAAFRARS